METLLNRGQKVQVCDASMFNRSKMLSTSF